MSTRPLEGIRVVDLGCLATAYATMLMAGLGADVITVEPPGGSPLRHLPPVLDGVAAPENGLWFAYLGQGKRSIVIDDLQHSPELRKLLAAADVVIDSSPPGTYDELRGGNPHLVWVTVSPFGSTGPRRDWKGSDLTAWASAGILFVTGFPDRPPVVPGGPAQLACLLAGLNACAASLMALRARSRANGTGQFVDISMQECCLSVSVESGAAVFLDDRIHRSRPGNRRRTHTPWGLFPCKDGFASVLGFQPAHWRSLARWIAEVTGEEGVLEEVFADSGVRYQTYELIDEWTENLTRRYTKHDLFVEGQRRGIPVSPVHTIADLPEDPHLSAIGFFEKTEHPALGAYRRPGSPFRSAPSFWSLGRAPPAG